VIAQRYIGRGALFMLVILLVAILTLVCATFLNLSATALTSTASLERLEMSPDQTMFRINEKGEAVIGGIASMSVIVITVFSPLIGYLYLKKQWRVWVCCLLAMGIAAVSIAVGLKWPVSVAPQTWKLLLSGYVLLAAGLPVWLFLQSRDFINVHILYAGMVFLVTALILGAIRGGGQFAGLESLPASNLADAAKQGTLGPVWPMMFITIACGAVSGFHSLCAGGTTCKQLSHELAARQVGYWAMLLEGFLAVCVVCCLLVGLSLGEYRGYVYPGPGGASNPVLAFAMAIGHTANVGFGLPIAAGALGAMLLLEGFLVTTLDTAVRLCRYLIEEGWATLWGHYDVFADQSAGTSEEEEVELVGAGGLTAGLTNGVERLKEGLVVARGWKRAGLSVLKHYWINSGIAVGLMLAMAMTSGAQRLWGIFGAANQLLAAMSLLVGSVWLLRRGRTVWYTLLPAGFMLITSGTMLVRSLVLDYIPKRNIPLVVTDVIVLAMAAGIVVMAVRRLVRREAAEVKGKRNEAFV